MGLVLLRHGESVWNLQNRFTGWTDVELTDKGIVEAHTAGVQLLDTGYSFDAAFTSLQKRAIKTLWIVLDEMDLMWLPVVYDWRLNERHYGALQGYNKARMADRQGKEVVFKWRRTYEGVPPKLKYHDARHPRFDKRYQNLNSHDLPGSESLKDTLERVKPYWEQVVFPEVLKGKNVLVVAHGNSLRALVKYLNHITDQEIPDLHIPTGIPMIYELDGDQVDYKGYLWEPGKPPKVNLTVQNE